MAFHMQFAAFVAAYSFSNNFEYVAPNCLYMYMTDGDSVSSLSMRERIKSHELKFFNDNDDEIKDV